MAIQQLIEVVSSKMLYCGNCKTVFMARRLSCGCTLNTGTRRCHCCPILVEERCVLHRKPKKLIQTRFSMAQ